MRPPEPTPTPDALSPEERRLISLERRQVDLGNNIRLLRIDAYALWQHIWDAWSDLLKIGVEAPTPTPTPTPTPVVKCGGCCAGVGMPINIPFVDSVYGSGTLVYNTSLGSWTACLSGLAYPGGSGTTCAAQTIAIQYVLNTSCGLTLLWNFNAFNCPTASTCATVTGTGVAFTQIATSCGTNPATVTFKNPGVTARNTNLYPGAAAQTVTISLSNSAGTCTPFSGSVVACPGVSGTSAFSGDTVTATAGGVTYWTGTVGSSGTFSGAATLTATTTLTFTCTPSSTRVTTGTTTRMMTPGTTYSAITVSCPNATNYRCWTPGIPYTSCSLPLPNTLTVTPTNPCGGLTYPGDTLTWQAAGPSYITPSIGSFPGWLGTATFSLPSGWPAGSYVYWFSKGVLYLITPSGGGAVAYSTFLGPGSQTCPTASSPFIWTTPCAGGPWGGTVSE